jgi:Resolvase, N terminal domain
MLPGGSKQTDWKKWDSSRGKKVNQGHFCAILAQSARDLLNILHQLAEKGAKFKSLHDPWCDTSTPQGDLLVTILAGFAAFERLQDPVGFDD